MNTNKQKANMSAPDLNLSALLNYQGNGNPLLLCPVCGFHCVHIAEVDILAGDKGSVNVSSEGIKTSERPAPSPLGRGTQTTLVFRGECGHWFTLSFEFHKGNINLKVSHVPANPIADIDIWRD